MSMENNFYIEHIKKDECLKKKTFSTEDFYELSYFVVGERKYIVDDVIFKIKPGMVVLSKKDKNSKTTIYNESTYERILIRFHASYLEQILTVFNGIDVLGFFNQKIKIVKLDFDQKVKLENILFDMVKLNDLQTQYSDISVKLSLCMILAMMSEHLQEKSSDDIIHYGEKNPKISEIITYINSNYTEDITLNHLAQRFYLSPFYLSKLFKQVTNITVVQYLNTIRVKKAKYHLIHTNDKIIDIAFRVGFNSNTHFTRVFNQICNESPNHFRKRHFDSHTG